MATVNRGDFVLGLEPDSRMPNDYLRMVARVFAAYREIPLEMSIVAYVDGYKLNLNSVVGNIVTIGITHGTAFVDDQFVGFIDSSELVINGDELVVDVSYSIVLYYQWINIMPPQEPTYNIVRTDLVDPEHMLDLGQLFKRSDGSWDLIDNKVPWWADLLEKLTGDTEIDGPELLPYIPFIKENETEDIGWALDFHHNVGNNIDYNVRLHTDRAADDKLFINGDRILTTVDFDADNQKIIYYLGQFATAPTIRNDGTSLLDGDVYYNTTDHKYFYWKLNGWAELGSGGGSGGGTATVHHCEFIATAGQTMFNCIYNPEFLYVSLGGLDLASSEYIATNGTTIELNIPAQAGEVLQSYSITEIPVNGLGLDDLNDVTITGVTDDQVIAWDDASSQWINKDANFSGGGGGSDLVSYEFIATDGQTVFTCDHDANWVYVSSSGVDLADAEFVADGSTITLVTPTEENDIIKVFSAISGLNNLVSEEFTATLGQTVFTVTHNPNWVYVSVSGIDLANAEFVADGSIITLVNPAKANDIVKVFSATGSGGSGSGSGFGMTTWCEHTATAGQTNFACEYDPTFVYVSVAGVELDSGSYTATNGQNVILDNPANLNDIIIIRSVSTIGQINITNLQDNQVLSYDEATDTWVNTDPSGGSSGGGTLNEYNFDATDGQTDFVINNETYNSAAVYTNGVRNRNMEFSVSNDGTDTTVVFNVGKLLNDWVLIESGYNDTGATPPPATTSYDLMYDNNRYGGE